VRKRGGHVLFCIVQWQDCGCGCGCVPLLPFFSLHVTAICTEKEENEAAYINALKHSLSVLYALLTLT
jgi:hypothetical protein